MAAFYVDFESGQVHSPNESIDKQTAQSAYDLVKYAISAAAETFSHVSSTAMDSSQVMHKATLNYFTNPSPEFLSLSERFKGAQTEEGRQSVYEATEEYFKNWMTNLRNEIPGGLKMIKSCLLADSPQRSVSALGTLHRGH